jgi:hypothetical protein
MSKGWMERVVVVEVLVEEDGLKRIHKEADGKEGCASLQGWRKCFR